MSKKKRFFGLGSDTATDANETMATEEQPVVEIHCPSCHTLFNKDEAPWLMQALHCAKHDRVRLAGTECEFCVAEAAAEE